MKNYLIISAIISLFLSVSSLNGQDLKSNKKRFRITTGKIEIELISSEIRGFKPTSEKSNYPIIENKTLEVIVDVQGGVGLKNVYVNDWKATMYSDGYYYRNIKLSTGENVITVVAEDEKGNKATKTTKVICSYQYDINTNDGKYCAFIIGVSDYEDELLSDLNKPIEDAKQLKKLLISNYTFLEEDVILLENPTRSELIKGFEDMAAKVKKQDNLLIFFAGHGIWNEDMKTGYWLPSNADATESDNWLRNSTVKEFISSINSKHTLLVTDACFGGSIFKTRSANSAGITAYNKLYKLQSRKGMTSSTLEKVPDNSVFFKYLFKRLEQNEEKYLPAGKLFNSMRDAVLNNSPNVPQYGTIFGAGDEGGEFIFIKSEIGSE